MRKREGPKVYEGVVASTRSALETTTRFKRAIRHGIAEFRQAMRTVINPGNEEKIISANDDGPLAGIRVCDLTRILAGPFATMKLADMGAEVIKVERPRTGDDTRTWGPPFTHSGESCYFLSVNRGKKSLALDLKSERGKEILRRLISYSDVVISNFRPGTMETLGFGPEQVAELNRLAVYCTISGYGDIPEQWGEASYDIIIQGESGVQDLSGTPDGPPTKMGISVADEVAGILAVEGVLAALIARQRTGHGERVDVSLLDGMLSLLTYQAQGYFITGVVPQRIGNKHPSIVPYQSFSTQDGWINVGIANDKLWQKFCHITGRSDLSEDERFATNANRVRHREILIEILNGLFAQQSSNYWIEKLESAAIPVGRTNNVADAVSMESAKNRGTIIEVDHPTAGRIRMIGPPIRFADRKIAHVEAPPLLGQHTDEILLSIGFSEDEIAILRRSNTVG